MTPIWLADTVTRDLDRAIHYTLLWGLEGIELRTLGKPFERVPFVNEEKLKRRMKEHQLSVLAIDPGLFEGSTDNRSVWLNEIAQLEETAAFCRRLGCSCVVASAFAAAETSVGRAQVDALRRAGDVLARYGMTLAVLNEAELACATGTALGRLLTAVDHPAVQAAWHPAEAVRAGEDPEEGLAALGDKVALVRCSNGVWQAGQWMPTALGEGAIDWERHLVSLHAQGFDGPVSLEITVEPRPKQGFRMASMLLALLRKVGAGTA